MGRAQSILGPAVCACVAALHALALWVGPWRVGPVDDEYIVYAYARTWLDTGSFALFPGGPEVEGVTSPLWFLVAALGVALDAPPEWWTPLIGTLAFAGLTLAVGRAAGRWISPRAGWLVALVTAVHPALGWHAVAGLGSVPMAACVAVGIVAWARAGGTSRVSRPVVLGALAFSAAAAFRLEGALVAVPLAACLLCGAARAACILATLGTAGAVTAWRLATFGELVPVTARVKALPIAQELEYGSAYLIRSLSEGGLAVLLIVAVLGLSLRQRAPDGTQPARTIPEGAGVGLAIAAALALVYTLAVGGDWMVYSRFLVPFAPVGLLGAAIVGARLCSGKPLLLPLGTVALLALTLVGFRPHAQARFEYRFFEAWWLQVGDALRDRTDEGRTIATSPIGAIAWRSERPIVDVLGLTHDAFGDVPPDLAGVGMKGHHRHSGGWVLDQTPDYLVLGNGVIQPGTGSLDVNPWEADIVSDERFRARYVPAQASVAGEDGTDRVLPYFRRADAPPIASQ